MADHFQTIDCTDCPPEFRIAFQTHINAWRNAQNALAGNTLGANFAEGLLGGLTQNYNGFGAAQSASNDALLEVNATYNTLTQIAAAHGAKIPRSVVE